MASLSSCGNKVTLLKPFEDVEFKRVYRALPKVLTVQE